MKHLTFCLLLSILSTALAAQQPCPDNYRKGLRKNEQFKAHCDSMVVLSKAAFEDLNLQIYKLKREISLHEEESEALSRSVAYRDTLMQTYQKEIRDFEQYLKDTEQPIQRLQENLEKSIENTDKVLEIARRNKMLGILAGGLGGILAGVIIGAAAF